MIIKRIRREVPSGGNQPVLVEDHFSLLPHQVRPGDVVVEAHPFPHEEIEEIPDEEEEEEEGEDAGTD